MKHGESATERFEALLVRAKPARGRVALREIAAEVQPLLSLLSELPAEQLESGDFDSFEFRECLTVLTLVGRRLALLDLTPTTAIQVVRLALITAHDAEDFRADGFSQRAIAAVVEGFVLGREERVAAEAERLAAMPIAPLRIDDAALALIITGVHEPTVLSECADALGRAMLNADVGVAIVDLTQLGEPNRERATAIFTADEVARMLGGVCFFTGLDSRWTAAASDAHIALEAMHITRNLAEALAAARELRKRTSARDTPKWRSLLDRLRR